MPTGGFFSGNVTEAACNRKSVYSNWKQILAGKWPNITEERGKWLALKMGRRADKLRIWKSNYSLIRNR